MNASALYPCCSGCFATPIANVPPLKPTGTPRNTCEKLYSCTRCLFATFCSEKCYENHIPCRDNRDIPYEQIRSVLLKKCPRESGSFILHFNTKYTCTEIEEFSNPNWEGKVGASIKVDGRIIGIHHFVVAKANDK